MTYIKDQWITQAHKNSANHRKEIEASEVCGCFFCLETFEPKHIEEWTDEGDDGEGTTAMCPRCGIDSVIGSKSGYPIEKELLEKMRKYWFES
ncbi:hypothetical protein [Pelagicoccus albus]|uniref:Cytoplasmic protein n=1 Tax=Pelagicoccus albus TaxID=415222 RepID=A0A7X1B658_9BACT|nr:hypothetical protein [Pelagicoccus albus]MBC2606327.1 hypothetical protein [Pelagicoccus albus]